MFIITSIIIISIVICAPPALLELVGVAGAWVPDVGMQLPAFPEGHVRGDPGRAGGVHPVPLDAAHLEGAFGRGQRHAAGHHRVHDRAQESQKQAHKGHRSAKKHLRLEHQYVIPNK